jgi:hypothetical protein
MKAIYILIVLVVAASALGCVGNKQTSISTKATVSPAETSVSTAGTTVSSTGTTVAPEDDQFGTENDLATMDSLVADSNTDISFSDSI